MSASVIPVKVVGSTGVMKRSSRLPKQNTVKTMATKPAIINEPSTTRPRQISKDAGPPSSGSSTVNSPRLARKSVATKRPQASTLKKSTTQVPLTARSKLPTKIEPRLNKSIVLKRQMQEKQRDEGASKPSQTSLKKRVTAVSHAKTSPRDRASREVSKTIPKVPNTTSSDVQSNIKKSRILRENQNPTSKLNIPVQNKTQSTRPVAAPPPTSAREARTRKIQDLEASLLAITEQHQNLKLAYDTSEKSLSALRNSTELLSIEYLQKQKSFAEDFTTAQVVHQAQVDALSSELQDIVTKLSEKNTENVELLEKVDILEQNQARLEEEIEDKNTELHVAEEEHKELEATFDVKLKELLDKELEIYKDPKAEIDSLRSVLEMKQQTVHDLNTKYQLAQDKLAQFSDHKVEIERLQDVEKRLLEEKAEAQSRYRVAQDEIEEHVDRIYSQDKRAKSLQQKIDELEFRLHQLSEISLGQTNEPTIPNFTSYPSSFGSNGVFQAPQFPTLPVSPMPRRTGSFNPTFDMSPGILNTSLGGFANNVLNEEDIHRQ